MKTWPDIVGEARWSDGRLRVIDHGAQGPRLGGSGAPVCVGEFHATTAPETVNWVECLAGPTRGGALPALTGGFAVAAVDAARAALLLATDPFGTRGMYYWSD